MIDKELTEFEETIESAAGSLLRIAVIQWKDAVASATDEIRSRKVKDELVQTILLSIRIQMMADKYVQKKRII